jgi:hypothetical protein
MTDNDTDANARATACALIQGYLGPDQGHRHARDLHGARSGAEGRSSSIAGALRITAHQRE